MKVRWLKVTPGVYQTDTGRWTARKYPGGLVWWVYDSQNPGVYQSHGKTLREAKLFVDEQIGKEATQ